MSGPNDESSWLVAFGFLSYLKCLQAGTTRLEDMATKNELHGRVITASWDKILMQRGDGCFQIYWCLDGKVCDGKTFDCKCLEDAVFMDDQLCIVADGNIKFIESAEDSNTETNPETLLSHVWKKVSAIENYEKLFALTDKCELYEINAGIPSWIPTVVRVTHLSCGVSHGVVLSDNGTVYTWGNGSRGQLGHGCLDDLKKPKLVDILCGVNITGISAGGWHSMALADTGDIYVWGWNESGQLGFPAPQSPLNYTSDTVDSIKNSGAVGILNSPKLLEFEKYIRCENFVTICSIACGSRHSAAVTKDGKAITWGWGKYGQLGQKCCVSVDANSTTEKGSKRLKLEPNHKGFSELPRCCGRSHLPGLVEYFVTNCVKATTVRCGGWNTFFGYDDS